MTTNKRIVCLPVFGLCLALLCASGCRRAALPAGRNGFALDTAVSITLYALAEGAPAPDALLDDMSGCSAPNGKAATSTFSTGRKAGRPLCRLKPSRFCRPAFATGS